MECQNGQQPTTFLLWNMYEPEYCKWKKNECLRYSTRRLPVVAKMESRNVINESTQNTPRLKQNRLIALSYSYFLQVLVEHFELT